MRQVLPLDTFKRNLAEVDKLIKMGVGTSTVTSCAKGLISQATISFHVLRTWCNFQYPNKRLTTGRMRFACRLLVRRHALLKDILNDFAA